MREKPYWVVWNPGHGGPTVRHGTEAEAVAEAERLARRFKGETFYVLKAVCGRCVDDMQRIDMSDEKRGFGF